MTGPTRPLDVAPGHFLRRRACRRRATRCGATPLWAIWPSTASLCPSAPTTQSDSEFATKLRQRAGVVVRVVDGFCVSTGETVEGLSVEIDETNDSLSGETLLQRYESDSFALLNAALAPSTTVLRVEAGVNLAQPIVVLNESSAGAHLSPNADRPGPWSQRDGG